jgi:hypothetical protein
MSLFTNLKGMPVFFWPLFEQPVSKKSSYLVFISVTRPPLKRLGSWFCVPRFLEVCPFDYKRYKYTFLNHKCYGREGRNFLLKFIYI